MGRWLFAGSTLREKSAEEIAKERDERKHKRRSSIALLGPEEFHLVYHTMPLAEAMEWIVASHIGGRIEKKKRQAEEAKNKRKR